MAKQGLFSRKPKTPPVVVEAPVEGPPEKPKRVKHVRKLSDLQRNDRFTLDGVSYKLASISEETAVVTRMTTAQIQTGTQDGKPVFTDMEYGVKTLSMPLETEID